MAIQSVTPSPALFGTEAPALAGLLVIDLTRVLGGPYCTQILADHGATVVKIEPPQGDETRDWGPPFHDGDASYFLGTNRGKRSVALDIATPTGAGVLRRLLETADVLVENLKPGSLERWGLGYEALSKRFPRLVHCSITGFGDSGPLGGLPGYDAIIQCLIGMVSANGSPEGGPTRVGIPAVDIGTGLYAAIAILMALVERDRSGRGQHLDVSLYDCGLSLMHPHFANYFLSGAVARPTGNAHPNICPYETYATGTVPIFLAAGNNRLFHALCGVIGARHIADDLRFANNAMRIANRSVLKRELEAVLGRYDGETLWMKLLAAGVPAGPIHMVDKAAANPHALHRGMIVEDGWYQGLGTPIKTSRTSAAPVKVPPRFSEHTTEVLGEFGYSETEIANLVFEGAVVLKRRR
jgi:formyl-CoA transferase